MAFTAKQKTKKRKAKKVRTVKAVEVRSPKRRPIEKRIPVAREVIVIEPSKKGTKMATKTKRRKSRKGATKRAVKRTYKRVAKTVRRHRRRVSKRVHRVARRVHRSAVKYSGGIITTNKKESLINLGCIGAGFIGSMAIMNLAPIPATIKNLKWKGAALSGITILLALKVKDKRARLALAGAAVYGIVDVLKNYIPQLASLSGYDSQRALILSGAVQSRARMSVGGSHGRTMAVGMTHASPAQAPRNRAMVTGASNYKNSETGFTSAY